MKKRARVSVTRKMTAIVTAALIVISFAAVVSAGVFDDFYDYQNEDGTYSYYFTQGVCVTMDKDWYQKTVVIPDDGGAAFYHKASYDAWQQKGMTGGKLFTLGASVNTDFQNLPSFEYIGFDEEACMNYFAVLPTDYQAYAEDEAIRAEYDALWAGVKDVLAGIELQNGSGSSSGGTASAGESSGDDGLFTRVYQGDAFSLEIPSEWESREMEEQDMLLASPDGSDLPPLFFVQKVDGDVSALAYAAELEKEFLDTYGGGIVSEPEIITYEPADTDRKLAGFRGVYSAADDPAEYTVLEYLENIGDDLYQYYCCYVSGTEAEGEHEDETTYFEFLHAIDTMAIED